MQKYALILGITSDMALAFAKKLAKENYNLYLAGRNKKEIEKIAKDLQIRYNITTIPIEIDLEKVDPKFLNSLKKQFTQPFEIFANFAGYLGNQKEAQETPEEISRIININYVKVVLLTEEVVSLMLNWFKNNLVTKPTILGVSSVAGDRGRQSNYFYGSAKAGYTTYLSGLRNRLFKEKIHVITVKPGFVYTKMTSNMNLPKLLTAQPEEVAEDIFKAVQRKTNILYTKWFWRYIMLIIRLIPEAVFKKLNL
ncbi:MAG: SDR family oxidoreductase [Leptonema sp. (in: bacteria)]